MHAGAHCMPLHLANATRPLPPPAPKPAPALIPKAPAPAPKPTLALRTRPTAALLHAGPGLYHSYLAAAPAPAEAQLLVSLAPASAGAPRPARTPQELRSAGPPGGGAPPAAGAPAPGAHPALPAAPGSAYSRGVQPMPYAVSGTGAPPAQRSAGPSGQPAGAQGMGRTGVAAHGTLVSGAPEPSLGSSSMAAGSTSPWPAAGGAPAPSAGLVWQAAASPGSVAASVGARAPSAALLPRALEGPGPVPADGSAPAPGAALAAQAALQAAAPAPINVLLGAAVLGVGAAADGLSLLQRPRAETTALADEAAGRPSQAPGPGSRAEAGAPSGTPGLGYGPAAAPRGTLALRPNAQASTPAALAPPGVATWVAQRTGLAVGLGLALAALAVLVCALACCVLRARRRAAQGRDGGGWGAALLPTPSPHPGANLGQGSPLHLREKFGSAPASPSLQDLMERLSAKEAMHAAGARPPSAWASPASTHRIPPRPSRIGTAPAAAAAASGASSSAAASGSTGGQPAPAAGAAFTPARLVAAEVTSARGAGAGFGRRAAGEPPVGAADAGAVLTFNPAFAMDPDPDPAAPPSSSGSPQRRDILPLSATMTPALLAGGADAAGASSDGSAGAPRLRGRSLFQDAPSGAATPERGAAAGAGPPLERTPGGLPRLPLSPGTAKRLRRPSAVRARKENAPGNAQVRGPEGRRSPLGKRALQAPGLHAPGQEPDLASPAAPRLPPPGVSESPALGRAPTPDSGMLRTGPAAALSLDASRSNPAGLGSAFPALRGRGGLPLSPLRHGSGPVRCAAAHAAVPDPDCDPDPGSNPGSPPALAAEDATPARHAGSAARARRRLQEQGLRASDSVLQADAFTYYSLQDPCLLLPKRSAKSGHVLRHVLRPVCFAGLRP